MAERSAKARSHEGNPPHFTLRDYQMNAVEVLSDNRLAGVFAPPGSGKTVVMRAALTLSDAPVRVMVTPVAAVERAFARNFTFSHPALVEEVIEAAPVVIGRDIGTAQEAIWSYAEAPEGRIFVTTHAAFARAGLDDWDLDYTDWHIIIDEAHHSGLGWTRLNDLVEGIVSRGGTVGLVTATPERADGRLILSHDAPNTVVVPYSRLATDYGFPGQLDVQLLELDAPASEMGTPGQIDWTAIATHIMEVGRPTVLQVPQGNEEGGAAEAAEHAITALVAAGIERDQIVNAVGSDTDIYDRLEAAADETVYADRSIHVIVSCQRMGEASDWPMCSHVVMLGVTNSLLNLLQRFGRAFRPKAGIEGYPDPDRAILSLVIGRLPDEATAQARLAHMLLHISLAVQVSPAALAFNRYWKEAVSRLRVPPAIRHVIRSGLDENTQQQLAEARENLLLIARETGAESFSELVGVVRDHPALEEDARLDALRELLFHGSDTHPEVRQALMQTADRTLRLAAEQERFDKPQELTSRVRDLFYEALLEEADRIEKMDLQAIDLDFSIEGFRSVLTPARLEGICERMLRQRREIGPTSLSKCLAICELFENKHGKLPSRTSGPQRLDDLVLFRYSVQDLDFSVREATEGRLTLGKLVRLIETSWVLVGDHKANQARYALRAARMIDGEDYAGMTDTEFVHATLDPRLGGQSAYHRFWSKGARGGLSLVAAQAAHREGLLDMDITMRPEAD